MTTRKLEWLDAAAVGEVKQQFYVVSNAKIFFNDYFY
jgi:hypothetical protein